MKSLHIKTHLFDNTASNYSIWHAFHLKRLIEQIFTSKLELNVINEALGHLDRLEVIYPYQENSMGNQPVLSSSYVLYCPTREFYKKVKLALFLSHNAVLETYLLADNFASLPDIGTNRVGIFSKNLSHFDLSKISNSLLKNFGYNYPSLEDLADPQLNRFAKITLNLNRLILSVSPFVQFSPPFILKRLEYQHQEKDRLVLSVSDRASWFLMLKNNGSIDYRQSHQQISFLHTRRIKSEFLSKKPYESNQLPISPVCASKLLTMQFYNNTFNSRYQDVCLREFIHSFVDRAYELCSSTSSNPDGCNQPRHKHVFHYTNSNYRVNIHINVPEVQDCDSDNETIILWTHCRQCNTSTSKIELSDVAGKISFAKYLELVLHDSSFTCHTQTLCKQPLNRFSTDVTLLEKVKSSIQSITSGGGSSIYTFGSQGAKPDHRVFLSRCFKYRNHIIFIEFERINLYEIALPKRVTVDELQVGIDVDYNLKSVSNATSTFQQPMDRVRQTFKNFWTYTYEYINEMQEKIFDSGKSDLLNKYCGLFVERLRMEEKHLDKMIEMAEQDYLRQENLAKERKKIQRQQSNISQSYSISNSSDSVSAEHIFSSPTISIRNLRRTLWDKIISIQREVQDWTETIRMDYPSVGQMLPKYEIWYHADSYFRKVRQIEPKNDHVSSFIAYALVSKDTRDLMEVLEEAYEISEFSDNYVSRRKNLDSWLQQEVKNLGGVLESGKYPNSFESISEDGLIWTEARLIEGKHIKFTLVKYKFPLNVDKERESRDRTRAKSSSSNISIKSCPPTGEIETHKTVTIYYALFFAQLRDLFSLSLEDFTLSLSKCAPWNPSGGKSASRFWKTHDNRYVLKQLGLKRSWQFLSKFSKARLRLNTNSSNESNDDENQSISLNEEEKRMMVDFLPKYLAYMILKICGHSGYAEENSAEQPTLLVKIFGSYKIDTEIHKGSLNGVGEENSVSLLLMEDLFHGREISQVFDLKGIKTRSVEKDSPVKASSNGFFGALLRLFPAKPMIENETDMSTDENKQNSSRTLWDGNWIQSNESSFLIHPHSKFLLRRAIDGDTEFLMNSNIVDYSLLVGVDEKNHELVMGIVDYLVEFNIWKKLENTGKVALKNIEQGMKNVVQMNIPKSLDVGVSGESSISPTSKQEYDNDHNKFEAKLRTTTKRIPSFYGDRNSMLPTTSFLQTSSATLSTSFEVATAHNRNSSYSEKLGMSGEKWKQNQEKIWDAERVDKTKPENPGESVTIQPPQKYQMRFVSAMAEYFLMVPDKWTLERDSSIESKEDLPDIRSWFAQK